MTPLAAALSTALSILVLFGLVYFGFSLRAALLSVRRLPRLRDVKLRAASERWPRLSLIIAARNEEATLEAATLSRLHDDYPELEVVLVDDRSTDDTGAIADRLALRDSRVRVVHVRELPEGWLGKVHAMQRGLEAATGDWILFSDADVHLAPGTLRRAISHAEAAGLGHLSAIPHFDSRSFLVDTMMGTFIRTLMLAGRPWAVGDPISRAAVGGGLFNLVHRDALARSPGLSWIKLEVGDDVALAQMLKRSGARTGVVDAVDHIHLALYGSVGEMARGLEKNGHAVVGRFQLPLLLATVLVALGLELSPLLGLVAGPHPLVRLLAGISLGCALLSSYLLARWMRAPLLPALLFPLGTPLLLALLLRSGWLGTWRGGIVWRDTFYPSSQLRDGARLQLF